MDQEVRITEKNTAAITQKIKITTTPEIIECSIKTEQMRTLAKQEASFTLIAEKVNAIVKTFMQDANPYLLSDKMNGVAGAFIQYAYTRYNTNNYNCNDDLMKLAESNCVYPHVCLELVVNAILPKLN